MLTGTKLSILEYDAILNKETLGYIVILDNQVYLYNDTDKIKLNQDDKIKIVNGRDYMDVSYDDVLNTKCDYDMPLYAGKTAFVRDR